MIRKGTLLLGETSFYNYVFVGSALAIGIAAPGNIRETKIN
jgi:hypothetical protein